MLATSLPPLIKALYVVDLTNCEVFHMKFCINSTKSIGQTIYILHMKMKLTGTRKLSQAYFAFKRQSDLTLNPCLLDFESFYILC